MVINDDHQVCRLLGSILENEGANVVLQHSAQQGLLALKSRPVDVLFTDLRVGDGDGLSIISEAHKLCPDLSTIVVTGYGSVESSVGALRLGAVDYLTKPFRAEQVAQALARACSRVARPRAALPVSAAVHVAGPAAQVIIAQSPAMREVLVLAKRVAQADVPLLVTGEQGVGKELILRAICQSKHALGAGHSSKSTAAPFKTSNSTPLCSERKHSAPRSARPGRWNKPPTVFCSCITSPNCRSGCRPGSFRRFRAGPSAAREAISRCASRRRIAASTTQDLSTLAASGKFFHELYYYLNVVPTHVPSLRHRREDIAPLADQFLQESLRMRPAGKPLRSSGVLQRGSPCSRGVLLARQCQ